MASTVDIYNMALTLLGQNPISDPDGTDAGAQACRQVYTICRKTLLEEHPWNFAIKRTSLAQETSTPESEFSYQYTLPNDIIRIVKIYGDYTPFSEEQGKILSDSNEIELVYVVNLTDPEKFSPLFTQLLTYDIAIAIEYRITNQQSLQNSLQVKRRELMIKAKMVDAQRSNLNKTIQSNVHLSMDTPYGLI